MTRWRNTRSWSRRVGTALLGACLAWASVARADDTEVFIGQAAGNPAVGRSNILFILDNSGSMDTEVATQAEWDPGAQFTGCYRSDAIYFSSSTAPPPCDSPDYVPKAANRCAASGPSLASRGQFSDPVLGWDSGNERWEPLDLGAERAYLECEADRGVDGGGAAEPYAANGPAGPWAADDSQEPAWTSQTTLFDGNWLNWRDNPPTVMRTRLQIVQRVVSDVLDNVDNVNVGLVQFNFNEGGTVSQALTNIATSRETMRDAVNQLTASTRTPLSETLYEAALYLRGGAVDFGNVGPVLSVPASRINGNPSGTSYNSPIDEECQKNFIILLTDGEPSGDENGTARIEALPGFAQLIGSCDGSGEGACLDDLAAYLYQTDARPDLPGIQNVVTYTIGFAVDSPLLDATARRGGGRYYLGDDTGSLATALSAVVAGISERAGTFVAPTIPASTFNRAADDRDVYVSVFQPTGSAHWPGNLKKYRFTNNKLTDQFGQDAVDPATGYFQADVSSFWSDAPDGDRVADGGAANRLPAPAGRKVYTDISGPALSSTANRVEVTNSAITAALLGVAAGQRDNLIRWIRGSDIADLDGDGDTMEARHQMGDPLHVRPVALSYGQTADNPDTIVFVTTNDGFLHAVDAATGTERWAYVPGRLLPHQQDLLLDALTPVRPYGLDGEIRLYIVNDDGRPGIVADERAILLFGMGRGGSAVFAVEVTDPAAPRLLWQVDRMTPGFSSLGQVWAAPPVAAVRIGTTIHNVAVLSGGYDDAQDNPGYRTDTVGNAMYFVDVLTGDLLWSAGLPGEGHDLALAAMQNSIPAAPRVLDLSNDGLADRMYVADTGGRLWRFDIDNGRPAVDLVNGGVLASLGAADIANPAPADVRRFYVTPDVVLVVCVRGTFLAINIGSGYRGHPLDTTTDDQFFSVRDPNVFGAIASDSYPQPVRVGDLPDITSDPQADVPPDAAGWRLRLTQDAGEKVLGPAVTLDNATFFTTFSPSAGVSACLGGLGVNRAYEVNLCNGRPLTNLDGTIEPEPLSIEDRFRVLSQAGIAPEPVFLFTGTALEGATRCIGMTCFPPEPGATNLKRTYWVEEPAR